MPEKFKSLIFSFKNVLLYFILCFINIAYIPIFICFVFIGNYMKYLYRIICTFTILIYNVFVHVVCNGMHLSLKSASTWKKIVFIKINEVSNCIIWIKDFYLSCIQELYEIYNIQYTYTKYTYTQHQIKQTFYVLSIGIGMELLFWLRFAIQDIINVWFFFYISMIYKYVIPITWIIKDLPICLQTVSKFSERFIQVFDTEWRPFFNGKWYIIMEPTIRAPTR